MAQIVEYTSSFGNRLIFSAEIFETVQNNTSVGLYYYVNITAGGPSIIDERPKFRLHYTLIDTTISHGDILPATGDKAASGFYITEDDEKHFHNVYISQLTSLSCKILSGMLFFSVPKTSSQQLIGQILNLEL